MQLKKIPAAAMKVFFLTIYSMTCRSWKLKSSLHTERAGCIVTEQQMVALHKEDLDSREWEQVPKACAGFLTFYCVHVSTACGTVSLLVLKGLFLPSGSGDLVFTFNTWTSIAK